MNPNRSNKDISDIVKRRNNKETLRAIGNDYLVSGARIGQIVAKHAKKNNLNHYGT